MGPTDEEFMKRHNMKPGSTRALVNVNLTVETSAWGSDCTIAQAVAQSCDSAIGKISKLISDNKDITLGKVKFVRVVCDAEKDQ